MPSFVKIKKESSLDCLIQYGLCRAFWFTATRKGWNMKKDGQEAYFISEIEQWVPSEYFEVIEISPN